jgi:hypothetical protein
MSIKEKFSVFSQIVNRRACMSEGRFDGLRDEVGTAFGLNNKGEMEGMSITGIVVSFITIAIIVAIGVIVLSSVQTAMPALNESSPYYGLQASLDTTTVAGYGLIAIVVIIVAAAAIMYAVRMIR